MRVDLTHEPTAVFFYAGLLAARELIAREFLRRGRKDIAAAVRNVWWPSVGVDPTRETADDACAEALPIAMAFVEKQKGVARE